eukprot:1392574-Amorphochlora_amoeboformis.AAC.1
MPRLWKGKRLLLIQTSYPSIPLAEGLVHIVYHYDACISYAKSKGKVGGPNWGCNGKGNQLGGFALVVPWWPIK